MLNFYKETQPITNKFKLDEMCQFLSMVEGDVVEIGVFQGGSLVYMAKQFPNRHFYAYDTFEGMPNTSEYDNYHIKGDFKKTSYNFVKNVISNFDNITLIKGIYPESDNIKPKIIMAHLDVDIYSSTLNSLNYLKNLIVSGGRIYCDDVFWKDCEGATKALIEFCYKEKIIPKMKKGQFYIQF
jgi:O-methyltransferase